MSALGLLNFLVLQWLGVRLARCRLAVSHCPFPIGSRIAWTNGNGKSQRCRVVDTNTLQWYTLTRWIWPLTGWWSDYRWIARRS